MRLTLVLAAAVMVPGAVSAQSYPEIAAARRAGQVGERFDGYLGIAAPTPTLVQRQVSAINIRRRSLYIGLAQRRRVTPEVAGMAAGCELLSMIAVGEVYMLQDGKWRRRGPAEMIARPSYCS